MEEMPPVPGKIVFDDAPREEVVAAAHLFYTTVPCCLPSLSLPFIPFSIASSLSHPPSYAPSLPPCQVLVSEYSLGVAPVAIYSDNEALERAYYSRRNAPPGTSSDTLAHMTAMPDIASPRDG